MSFAYIHAIVPVSDGRRVQTIRAIGNPVWHAVYDSMIELESGGQLDGTLRTFAPASESMIPTDSLIVLRGKFALPSNTDRDQPPEFVMESIHHSVFTGDVNDDNYEHFLPAEDTACLSLLGNVVGSVVHMGDGGKAVDVRVSNYLQGKTFDTVFRCRFPPTARWAKVNMPMAGSVISVVGRPWSLSGADGTGILVITVDDIVYNPGAMHILADSNEPGSSPRRLQVKKRKRPSPGSKPAIGDPFGEGFEINDEGGSGGAAGGTKVNALPALLPALEKVIENKLAHASLGDTVLSGASADGVAGSDSVTVNKKRGRPPKKAKAAATVNATAGPSRLTRKEDALSNPLFSEDDLTDMEVETPSYPAGNVSVVA